MFKPRKFSGSNQYGGGSSRGGRSGERGGYGASSGRPGSKLKDSADSRGGRFVRKKVCRLCQESVKQIDYKDTEFILKFLTEKGKIIPRRITGNCAQHQRILAKAVKRSRHAAIVSFQIAG